MSRSSSDPLPAGAEQSVNDAAEAAVALARSQAPLRRVLAAVAGRVVARSSWERLGFVRLADYARERLGVSSRQLQELSHTDEVLKALPRVERGFVSGEVSWTKVRVIARVATQADEEHWLKLARKLTARALSREVRKVDQRLQHGCGRGGPAPPKPGHAPRESVLPGENLLLSLSNEACSSWYRARQFAQRVACRRLAPWECADAVLGEVLSGMDLDLELPGSAWHEGAGMNDWLGSTPPAIDAAPLASPAAIADGCASQGLGDVTGAEAGPLAPRPASADGCASQGLGDAATPCPLPPFLRDLVVGLDEADAFGLDARLLRAVKLEQSFHARLGPLLLEVARGRLYRDYGCLRMDDFASEHLGMSPRSVQALLRVERAAARCEPLAEAYREGRLSSEQAMALVPLTYEEGAEAREVEWVEHAQHATVKKLADDVERARATRIFDPSAFETRESWDSPAPAAPSEEVAASSAETGEVGAGESDEPQMGAQHTISGREEPGREDSGERRQIYIHAPRDVARLFRATLAAVQRAIERREDRSSDESEAFLAMAEHALATWRAMEALHSRKHPVAERGGWQCSVPGCTSYGELQDHHIRFRSAGGSDALSNRTMLCAAHHQRGVHAGRIRCGGSAPGALRFELGLREGQPPLITYEAPAAPEPRP